MKAFNVLTLQEIIQKKDYSASNKYLSQYFFKSGIHIYFKTADGTFIQYKKAEARELIPEDLKQYDTHNGKTFYDPRTYLSSTEFMANNYMPTIDFSIDSITFEKKNKHGVMVKYLNMARPAPNYCKLKVNRDKFQANLDIVYNHIKTVWANGIDEVNEWILNFIACSVAGRKLRQALYLPCEEERAGRGSILNFLERVLGDRMLKTSSVEDVMKYTKPLEGRTLVNLDEMPVDTGDYRSIADCLKSLITEPNFKCRDMYNTGYNQKNTFNFVITSNNNAVLMTQSNNKRYFIADINTVYKGNLEYFDQLNKILGKRSIEKLFYEDMIERFNTKCKDWNEDITPDTNAKKEKLIESLPLFTKWFKDNYALRKKDLNMKQQEFFEEYFRQNPKDKSTKIKVGKIMTKLGISTHTKLIKGKSFKFYIADGEYIYNKYKEFNWIDEQVDDIIEDENDDDYDDQQVAYNPYNPLDYGITHVSMDKYNDLVEKYKKLEQEIEQLKSDQLIQVVPKKRKKKLLLASGNNDETDYDSDDFAELDFN